VTKEPVAEIAGLPPIVQRNLDEFVDAAKVAFGPTLKSVVLYGSAAEGKLRATSDVNLILVLSEFEKNRVDELREPLRVAQAAIQLKTMFLLREEVGAVARDFAQKTADILRRRRVLYGEDVFAGVEESREALVFQLKQQLLNFTLRHRALYAGRSLREEQLVKLIADAAGPLRSCAATILQMEGRPASSPKAALEEVAGALGGTAWDEALKIVSTARETQSAPPGSAGRTLFVLLELANRMHARAEKLG
jgi:predicted nucleotidyltransferase